VKALCKYPRLIDSNAKSVLIRGSRKLLVVSRCLEVEKPRVLEDFKSKGYALLTACPEAEHVNMLGFKLAGVIARGDFEEVSVLTVDGSMHCTQLHWMLEEVFKIMGLEIARRHYVVHEGEVLEVSREVVKAARFLAKLAKALAVHGRGELA